MYLYYYMMTKRAAIPNEGCVGLALDYLRVRTIFIDKKVPVLTRNQSRQPPAPQGIAFRKMVKRPAEEDEAGGVALKKGDRPANPSNGEPLGDFEDEFEDEFESEDEIFEAGVDGRPDAEREAEEKKGVWTTPVTVCDSTVLAPPIAPRLTLCRCHGG
jgi:hypothetical protein